MAEAESDNKAVEAAIAEGSVFEQDTVARIASRQAGIMKIALKNRQKKKPGNVARTATGKALV